MSNELELTNKNTATILQDVIVIIEQARSNAARSVDFQRVQMYWQIGERIVVEEQDNKTRAEYGKYILSSLSKTLIKDYGDGFSKRNLERAHKFYIIYPIATALRTQLNWMQYRLLSSITDETKREYYELEAIKNKLNMLKASGIGRWTIYDIVVKEDILENSATKKLDSADKSLNSASEDILINDIISALDEKKRVSGEVIEKVILDLCRIRVFEKLELCELLDRKEVAIRRYLRKLVESGHLELLYPSILNHPKQAYKTVKKANETNK